MSKFSIDELLRSTPGDGCSVGINPQPPRMDFQDLFKAWTIESGQRIECEILLTLSRDLFSRLMMSTNLTQCLTEREATRDLIDAIEQRLRSCQSDRP